MTGRSIWRGTVTRKRAPTRTVKCPHCGVHYDVARDFDAHYQGACFAAKTTKEPPCS